MSKMYYCEFYEADAPKKEVIWSVDTNVFPVEHQWYSFEKDGKLISGYVTETIVRHKYTPLTGKIEDIHVYLKLQDWE